MIKSGFSVIIPVYNEEKVIVKNTEKILTFLNKMKIPFEIVLGNNGSTDRTEELGRCLEKKYKNIKFVSSNEKGVGIGIKEAILNSSYEKLVEMPMDLCIDLKFIPSCVELLDHYAIVIGSKKMGKQKRALWKIILSFGYIFLMRYMFGLEYVDYSVGGKGYKKSFILSRINKIDESSFYVTDFIYYAKKKKEKITEIPIYCEDRRKSRFNYFKEVLCRLKSLFSLWFSENILKKV